MRARAIQITFVAAALVVGCKRSSPGGAEAEPSNEPAPPTSALASASTVSPPVSPPNDAKAWTDASVIDLLARDCRWEPPSGTGAMAFAEGLFGEKGPSPLSCTMEIAEQSCVPDPCFEAREQTCEPACIRACGTCGDTCAASCEACKAPCTDDACRRACATQCGGCRQDCLREKDRCATGKCRAEQRTCNQKLIADWKEGRCSAACVAFRACTACDSDFESAACLKCRARAMGRCPLRFEMMCAFGVDPTKPDG